MQRSALVIVSGDDDHHDLFGASSAFTLLAAEAGLVARPAVGFKRFINPLPGTAGADVYLLYSDGGEFPIAQQQALVDLVRGGKGLLVVGAGHARRSWGDVAFRSLTIQALRWAARLTRGGDDG
jgi:uncharacterized protein